jgi:hypothetical protein
MKHFEAELLKKSFQLNVEGVKMLLKQFNQPFHATVDRRSGCDVTLSFDSVDLGSMIDHTYHFDSFKDEDMFVHGEEKPCS